MVHLEYDSALARSFAAQLDSLQRDVSNEWHAATPQAGFVEWAIAASESTIDLAVDVLDVGSLPDHRWTEAPILAAVGFRLHALHTSDTEVECWLDGMGRLMRRDPVPVDRNSFFFSPLELLGLATGARSAEPIDSSPLAWLRNTIDTHSDRLSRSRFWSRVLVSVAAEQLGVRPFAIEPSLPKDPLEIALSLWLNLLDDLTLSALTSYDAAESRKYLLEAAAVSEPELRGVAERGIFALALRDAVLAAIGDVAQHPTSRTQLLANLCRRFPLFAGELKSRYDKRAPFEISDEYDLQDLLGAILQLHFNDIRPEEWNPSYGGARSRSDFLLKSERIVVETKMTRAGLGQREVVYQLTVDKAQYRTHPDCDKLICFIYDPDLRLTNAAALERDLSDSVQGLRTMVVVSPKGL